MCKLEELRDELTRNFQNGYSVHSCLELLGNICLDPGGRGEFGDTFNLLIRMPLHYLDCIMKLTALNWIAGTKKSPYNHRLFTIEEMPHIHFSFVKKQNKSSSAYTWQWKSALDIPVDWAIENIIWSMEEYRVSFAPFSQMKARGVLDGKFLNSEYPVKHLQSMISSGREFFMSSCKGLPIVKKILKPKFLSGYGAEKLRITIPCGEAGWQFINDLGLEPKLFKTVTMNRYERIGLELLKLMRSGNWEPNDKEKGPELESLYDTWRLNPQEVSVRNRYTEGTRQFLESHAYEMGDQSMPDVSRAYQFLEISLFFQELNDEAMAVGFAVWLGGNDYHSAWYDTPYTIYTDAELVKTTTELRSWLEKAFMTAFSGLYT